MRGHPVEPPRTHDSLIEAVGFIQAVKKRQGQRINVPEEIAFNNGWISRDDFIKLGYAYSKNDYGTHLLRLADPDQM